MAHTTLLFKRQSNGGLVTDESRYDNAILIWLHEMERYMKFDRKGFDSFRNDLTEAVKAVEETHQVKLEAGSIRFDDLGFTMGTTWKRSDIDANKIDFERNCALYGFQPEDYQREFFSLSRRRSSISSALLPVMTRKLLSPIRPMASETHF